MTSARRRTASCRRASTSRDSLAFRGTVSTGFRAPTPGQANIVRTITQIVNGELSETGVLPPTNPIARAGDVAPAA